MSLHQSGVTAGLGSCISFSQFNKYADVLHTSAGLVEVAGLLLAKLVELLFSGSA